MGMQAIWKMNEKQKTFYVSVIFCVIQINSVWYLPQTEQLSISVCDFLNVGPVRAPGL